ncbi:acyl-CoA thioesterase FadM [Gillisia mitskevichiae]|uniref:Acyl-CoA thioesterase FadM n=2 Tax=Gillisia mitskevichiae TaxID=270921 RepID=A0A495PUR2_9FLAO|nr:acyl-CoA thioesterase FadM [Gillisia mitskevichiae]
MGILGLKLMNSTNMIYYWYTILKILVLRNFQTSVNYDETIRRTFRVGLMDCDGLRVMTASKYAVYMDFIRWELIARSQLYKAIVKRGLAPSLGSQKIIYRKPLKVWSKFDVVLENVGWDEKWVYLVHNFEQNKEVKAVGVVRALIWKKDIPSALSDIMNEIGAPLSRKPPEWVSEMFKDDKEIIKRSQLDYISQEI